MKYILSHSADGKTWKVHKYISRAFKKGRWVYTYAKNRARGNVVTNADAKLTRHMGPYSNPGKMQYSPNMKTFSGVRGESTPIPGISNTASMIDTKRYIDTDSNKSSDGKSRLYTGYIGYKNQLDYARSRKVRSESLSKRAKRYYNRLFKK